jgi:lipoyl(octanoyl) transferase
MTENAMAAARQPVPYEEAVRLQRLLVERRAAGGIADVLWLLEHPPTITWGSSGGLENLLVSGDALRARGIALCASRRGGNVTFHAPGQLVGYPIIDLASAGRDLQRYLRSIEACLISLLGELGIEALAIPAQTGVWVKGSPPRKIAAIGIRAKRWISSHGFALNVENALEGFDLIIPCGLRDGAVTSIAAELRGKSLPPWSELCARVHRALESALARPLLLTIGGEARTLAGGE